MTTILVKRGTTDKIAAYTGECGELVFDTDAKNLYVMDGETVGGIALGSSGGDVDGGQLEEPVEIHTLSIYAGTSDQGTTDVYDITSNVFLTSGQRYTTMAVEYPSNVDTFGVVVKHTTTSTDFYVNPTNTSSTNCTVDYNIVDGMYVITVCVTDVTQNAYCNLYLQPD